MDATGSRDQASEVERAVKQAELGALRGAVASVAGYAGQQLPRRRTLRKHAIAGLNSAIASVPDGLASGVLAGVNPVYGLYACMAGPIAGGILSSTQLMVVATTSATALGAGEAL